MPDARRLVLLVLLSSSAALALRISPALSRRATIAAAATAFLPAPSVLAVQDDALLNRLREVQTQLESAQTALSRSEWDTVRAAVKAATSPLTMKGYLGDSVKARAAATESADLAAGRIQLLRSLAAVDKFCYDRQQSQFLLQGTATDGASAEGSLIDAVAAMSTLVKLVERNPAPPPPAPGAPPS